MDNTGVDVHSPSRGSLRSAENQIRDLLEDRARAFRTKDAGAVLALHASENVRFLLAPPLQYVSNEGGGREGLEKWFATFDGAIGYESREVHIVADDQVAYGHGLQRLHGVQHRRPLDLWLRETLCFRRIEGAWKITHQHQSVPFHMDGSYKAAVDLKP